jgi:hypothetical protein
MCRVPRGLSLHEEQLLRFLLGDGRPGADRVLAALPYLRVVGQCSCGCGSVSLEDSRGPEDWERQDEFAEAVDEHTGVSVHVLVDEDRLIPTRLEAYGAEGDAAMPPVERLRLVPASTV